MITRIIIDCIIFAAGFYFGYRYFKSKMTSSVIPSKSEADQEREIIERYKQNNE